MKQEIEDVIGLDASDAVLHLQKAGIGIKEILEQVVSKVPAPTGDPDEPLKALIFDSHYDPYKGVIVYVRVSTAASRPVRKSVSWQRPQSSRLSKSGHSCRAWHCRRACHRRRWFRRGGYQEREGYPRRGYHYRCEAACLKHCQATAKSTRWYTADFILLIRRITTICGMR